MMSVSTSETELGFLVEVAEQLEQRGIYTGERLEQRKPELARACDKMLQYCVSSKMIAQLLGLDIRTVLARQEILAAAGSITPYKERTVAQLRGIITLGLDGLLEKARDGKIDPISMCALIDKHELLTGGATARVEVIDDRETDEFTNMVRRARGMVIEAGETSQKGGAPRGLGSGRRTALEMPPSDYQSPELEPLPVENQ